MKKTSRAVVLHEAATRMGYGAEIAATIQEEAFWYLDQPILRIGAKNTPTPTSPALEDAVIPQPADREPSPGAGRCAGRSRPKRAA